MSKKGNADSAKIVKKKNQKQKGQEKRKNRLLNYFKMLTNVEIC